MRGGLLHDAVMKWERANQHVSDLNRHVAEFFEQKTCAFVLVRDFKARETAVRFEERRPIPEEFGLIIGDAVHNFRASLDLAMWEILAPYDPNPEKIQFPFAKRANSMESTIASRLVQLAGPKIVAAIRDLKPYPRGNDDLYGLHLLDIADKHRVLIPAVSASSLEGIDIPGLDTTTWAYQTMSRVAFIRLKHKQEIWRFPYNPPPRAIRRASKAFKPEQDIGGSFHIAFAQGLPFEQQPVVPVLVRLSDCVANVLATLRRAMAE